MHSTCRSQSIRQGGRGSSKLRIEDDEEEDSEDEFDRIARELEVKAALAGHTLPRAVHEEDPQQSEGGPTNPNRRSLSRRRTTDFDGSGCPDLPSGSMSRVAFNMANSLTNASSILGGGDGSGMLSTGAGSFTRRRLSNVASGLAFSPKVGGAIGGGRSTEGHMIIPTGHPGGGGGAGAEGGGAAVMAPATVAAMRRRASMFAMRATDTNLLLGGGSGMTGMQVSPSFRRGSTLTLGAGEVDSSAAIMRSKASTCRNEMSSGLGISGWPCWM